MPKYCVTLSEMVNYQVEVEADNEEDAKITAERVFIHTDDLSEFAQSFEERVVSHVELLDEEAAA